LGVATALAGCADGVPAEATATTTPEPTPEPTTADATADATTDAPQSSLDLREANVVAVETHRRDDAYRFDVTLHHDDDGEDGYANWWQVETLDGERLGRRDLRHAHGTREFTRSATVAIPDGITCVVVRGHDRSHGYGGQAMLVNVETGTTTAVRGGSERASTTEDDCPDG